MQRSHALLLLRQRLGVELHALAVVARLARHVLQHVARLAQRVGELAQLGIVTRRTVERRHRAAQRVDGPLLARKRLMRPVRSDSQCLSMLHAGEVVQQLVVLALARIHRVDALQHEARLVELGRGRLARLAHARELGRRRTRGRERLLVGGARLGHGPSRPRVEHAHVLGCLHELLVLVLTAEVDGGRHGTGKLADAGHAAVDGHARTPVRGYAAHGDQLDGNAVVRLPAFNRVSGRPARKIVGRRKAGKDGAVEPPRHGEGFLAVADGVFVGARTHEQLQRREQRRLARARLAREHGQPARRHQRRLADQRQVLNLDLVDHRAPLTASFVPEPSSIAARGRAAEADSPSRSNRLNLAQGPRLSDARYAPWLTARTAPSRSSAWPGRDDAP